MLTFPCVPTRHYTSDSQSLSKEIEKMYLDYHNTGYSLLEDNISFNEPGEFLKRHYEHFEFAGKIAMLSEYYQYHRQLPRIFQGELHSIISNYQEDVRNEQYQLVTRKLRDGHYEQPVLTERDKKRPVQKVIKNIELSYYNFEKKELKKNKDKQTLSRNKKSMPALPLYQHPHKINKHAPNINLKPIHPNPPTQPNALRPKDTNKLSIKSRSKEQFKKPSLNNSSESPKNLSRSKSKSNLVMMHPQAVSKRNSVRPHQQLPVPISLPKNKSNPVSLQKTASSKNVLKKEQLTKKTTKVVDTVANVGDKNGLKTMFKKAMQTKKLIKIAR